MLEHLQIVDVAIIGAGLTFADIIFGITGFGSALMASRYSPSLCRLIKSYLF